MGFLPDYRSFGQSDMSLVHSDVSLVVSADKLWDSAALALRLWSSELYAAVCGWETVRALADYWNFRQVASVKYPVQHGKRNKQHQQLLAQWFKIWF